MWINIGLFAQKCTCMFYYKLVKHNSSRNLRDILVEHMQENGISEHSLADVLNIDRRALNKFIKEGADLKFSQAILIMRFLRMEEEDFISAYEGTMSDNESFDLDKADTLSYIFDKFDIPTLKSIGIIKKRTTIDSYEEQLKSFFGFNNSIMEYDSFIRHPALFSKSKRQIEENKARKMRDFWLKCAVHSFEKINNPYDYDKDTLIEFMKHIQEYTEDVAHGYEKAVMILYRLGVTVLTQPYMEKTGAFGVTMIIDDKPCIVITDMQKKYHKLWLSLIHELYHVINDYDLLISASYHITSVDEPDLLFNEEKADLFALRVLVPEDVLVNLDRIVNFEIKMKQLAKQLSLDSSILYGAYLDNLPKERQSAGYKMFSQNLKSTVSVTRTIFFNFVEKQKLDDAISEIKGVLNNIRIA